MKSMRAELSPRTNAEGRHWDKPMLSADSAPLWFKVDAIPLTPTLSLGERGLHHDVARIDRRSKVFKRRRPVLPLPRGEGWGEGEGRFRIVPRTGRGDQPTNLGTGKYLASKRSNGGGRKTSMALDWKLRRRGSTALPTAS